MNQQTKRFVNVGPTIFFLTTIIISAAIVFTLPRISIPLSIAYVLSLVLKPLFPIAKKLGLSKTGAVAAITSIIIGLFIFTVVRVSSTLKTESQSLENAMPRLEKFVTAKFVEYNILLDEKIGYTIDKNVFDDLIRQSRTYAKTFLLKIPVILAATLEWFFLVPLFLFFILKDLREFKQLFLKMVPNQFFERVYFMAYKFNRQIGDYIFAKFIEASLVGLIIAIGLFALDVPYALILGLVAGITNIIPYVGPLLGAVPGIIVCLVEVNSIDHSMAFYGTITLYFVANAIDIALVFPILVSKIVNIHPVLVVVSVIIGSQYLGVLGMVISIPVAAALKLLISEIYSELYPSVLK